MLWAGPSAPAFVVVDFLSPHDKPSGAILHKPRFAEEEMGSEKERDLPEATQRMTWSRAVTRPEWSEAKAVVLTSVQSYLSANSSELAWMPTMHQSGRAAWNFGWSVCVLVGWGGVLDKQAVCTGGPRNPVEATGSS